MGTGRYIWLLCIVGMFQQCLNKKQQGKIYANMEVVENCKEYSGKLQNNVVNITHNYLRPGIDGSFIVEQLVIPPKLMASFEVKKCKTLKDVNCERSLSGVVDYCKLITDKNQFYSPLYSTYSPKYHCPIKQGNYTFKDSEINVEAFHNIIKHIPEEYYYYYWSLKLKVFPPGKPKKIFSCIYLVFKANFIKN